METLDYKDKELEKFCRERFSIIAEIMSVYDYADVLQNVSIYCTVEPLVIAHCECSDCTL